MQGVDNTTITIVTATETETMQFSSAQFKYKKLFNEVII